MKRLPLLIALLLVPASGWAQGFAMDFDPEPGPAYAAEARQPAPPETEAGNAAAPRPRSVRYAQRSVRMVTGTSPMAAELDMSSLPAAER